MRREFRIAMALGVLLHVAGCGLTQTGPYSARRGSDQAIAAPARTVNIELIAQMPKPVNRTGNSVSTAIRIYQLKSAAHFEAMDYAQLRHDDIDALQEDLLVAKHIVLRADMNASISDTMHADAEFIGVAGFFRDADAVAQWKLILPRNQWDRTDPVRIEVQESSLELQKSNLR